MPVSVAAAARTANRRARTPLPLRRSAAVVNVVAAFLVEAAYAASAMTRLIIRTTAHLGPMAAVLAVIVIHASTACDAHQCDPGTGGGWGSQPGQGRLVDA